VTELHAPWSFPAYEGGNGIERSACWYHQAGRRLGESGEGS